MGSLQKEKCYFHFQSKTILELRSVVSQSLKPRCVFVHKRVTNQQQYVTGSYCVELEHCKTLKAKFVQKFKKKTAHVEMHLFDSF